MDLVSFERKEHYLEIGDKKIRVKSTTAQLACYMKLQKLMKDGKMEEFLSSMKNLIFDMVSPFNPELTPEIIDESLANDFELWEKALTCKFTKISPEEYDRKKKEISEKMINREFEKKD